MKKSDLTRDLARIRRAGTANAADELDSAVNRIIRTLRAGHEARLPGLGTLLPGTPWTFRREQK